jgi:cell division protein FtsI (penicillin-binding protein 3)
LNRRKRGAVPSASLWRAKFLVALFAIGAVVLEGRLIWLQLFEGDALSAEGDQRQISTVIVSAHRGKLLERYGEPLAVSTPVDSIYINPREATNDRDRIYELAHALDLDGEDLERRITSNKDRQFLWIRRELPPSVASDVISLGIEGVGRRREYARFYPKHEVTCHLVGLASIDDVGQEGLEYVFDYRLAAESGEKRVRKDLRGRVIADVEQVRAARPGQDVYASIDLRLQFPAYRALKAAVQASGASSGSLVLLDIETGEVLAMANQPTCNPNDREQRADLALFRNRAITDPIEPGSSIKPFVLATALASGFTPDTPIHVRDVLEVAGRKFSDDFAALGDVTVTDVLAHSSNVGMGQIGLQLEAAAMWQTFRDFGFGGPTDSELGALESHGSLDNYSSWGPVKHATLSWGYGLSVTTLQLARAYATIAAGGLMPPISFEALNEPPERVRVISPEIAAQLMQMLAVVVSDQGTASRAGIPNYQVAGKTGTARISEGGGYSDDKTRAIFAGIAPASKPRFVAVVVINDPRSEAHHGGDVAAPVFAKVMSTALRMYGVAPDALPGTLLLSRAEAGQ